MQYIFLSECVVATVSEPYYPDWILIKVYEAYTNLHNLKASTEDIEIVKRSNKDVVHFITNPLTNIWCKVLRGRITREEGEAQFALYAKEKTWLVKDFFEYRKLFRDECRETYKEVFNKV